MNYKQLLQITYKSLIYKSIFILMYFKFINNQNSSSLNHFSNL